MTDRATDTLTTIAYLAKMLEANAPAQRVVEHDLLPDVLRASAGGGGSSSGPADPTGNIAVAFTTAGVDLAPRSWADFVEHLDAALRHLRIAQARQAAVLKEHPERAREAAAALNALRCDGEIDPLCREHIVRSGKCWKCYKASLARRKNEHPICADSTPGVVRSAQLEASAPAQTVTGTCGRCGAEVAGLTVSHVRDLLTEHHTTTCPAR